MKTLFFYLMMTFFISGLQGHARTENIFFPTGRTTYLKHIAAIKTLVVVPSESTGPRSKSLYFSFTIFLFLASGIAVLTVINRRQGGNSQILEQKACLTRQLVHNAISKFIPNEILRSIGRDNISDVLLGDHVKIIATVLFADIRDYTGLAEQMSPEENFKFVNAFNRRMGPIIQEMNGFVNQYLGDGIMAIFPESPSHALRAAIKMQQALHIYNQERIRKNRKPIKIGIGMHTGPLIMGIIGDQNRMDAATISDTVNIAARIENLTKYYGAPILLSKTCLAMMPDDQEFNLRYLGEVKVKGREKVTGIYECFDGNPPEVMQSKIKIQSDFEVGMQHFFAQAFPEAILAFRRILQENQNDFVAQHFYNRSATLALNGVPENWTGVEEIFYE